ncbi:LOW QUALITY PROTEIN: MYCBP-associated protein [Dromiciops gliroides]|uniref:LOW QUALITY PROTEIN: MYCBP-associated protein n=1 Tax=Dromiciops gliroides TaxID=33562 RepID=UPI001CC52E0B|nr:LOW QUALITY PROTEIN: MYCBP-associated protein [Dromiciops gliroides]
MKSHRKEPRTKTPPEKKRAKVTELITLPIQEEPEPVSNVLQGDDILALAIKQEDLKKQHVPRPPALDEKTITHQVFIRKHKIQKLKKTTRYLVARPATPEAATKPLDYSGPAEESSDGKEHILPHNILGTLYDLKRVAIARGNNELADMIPDTTGMDSVIVAIPEEPKKQPKKEKVNLWLPPSQHKSLRNWKRNMTLRKKQQEALSEHLKKPVNELLMNTGESFRRIQEERNLIERSISALHFGKGSEVDCDFWSQPEFIGDELTGLVTQWPRGYRQPILHIGKPQSIQMESGLPSTREPWFRFTWDKSLFLIDRRKELRGILKELDFNQPDIDGLEVVGKGHPFSSVSAQHFPVLKDLKDSTSKEETSDPLADYPDVVPMPFLGPSLLFCGKPACWIDSNLPPGERQIGIAVRLTFETMEGERTSSVLTVVNNGTAAVWYDWRRLQQPDTFEEFKESKRQKFYFNNKEGVILPGETKEYLFFFKSSNAGIFRECWEFGTHPTLLGGALLQVTLRAVALSQDILKEDRKLLEAKLASQEAVTIVEEVMNELLRGIWPPERAASPVDAYLTEEDLFCYRNPQLHYQHQVVRELHELWNEYMAPSPPTPPPEEEEAAPVPVEEEPQVAPKFPVGSDKSAPGEKVKSATAESHKALKGIFPPQKDSKVSLVPQKNVILKVIESQKEEEEKAEEVPEPSDTPIPDYPKWNLCVDDFKKAVLDLPEEEQREDALIRLNKGALELCSEQRPLQSDLMYQMCYQLWRDVIDGLVSHSMWLKSLLGLPEKDTVYIEVPEEQEAKPSGKIGKEERKPTAQEKKQSGVKEKEEKKAGAKSPGREDRANSKKHKGRDEKKLQKSPSRNGKDRPSVDELAPEQAVSPFEPVDPLIQEKYNQRLYIEVYGLLDSLVTDMMLLFDELNTSTATQQETLEPLEPLSFSA